jgi:hypothetical protein
MDEDDDQGSTQKDGKAQGLIRVKRNLFEQQDKDAKKHKEDDDKGESSNKLVYNKKSMDIYVQSTIKDTENEECSRSSTPLLVEQEQEFENIVCSPTLNYRYMGDNLNKDPIPTDDVSSPDKPENMDDYDDDDDDDLFIEEANVCSNDVLFNMITEKFGNCDGFSNANGDDNELKRKLLISSVGSLNHQYRGHDNSVDSQQDDMKVAIGGLYLRNPRGEIKIYQQMCVFANDCVVFLR